MTRKAKVYKEDGSPYDGSAALVTFDFKNASTESGKYDFWLVMPIDDPHRRADTITLFTGKMHQKNRYVFH